MKLPKPSAAHAAASAESPAVLDSAEAGASLWPAIPVWFPPVFYLVLALLFLWRCVFTGDVFLPAGMLGHVAPWTSMGSPDQLPPWNPLRWDGIAQFYPWRAFAARSVHAGILPLWNPYQFSGTPFVANSQSAVFYPGNILFYILPVARAFGASAVLHLTLCGWFTYLLMRGLRCTQVAALLGGVVYAYSAWQVGWLQLPTFLATSCWFPLLLCQMLRIAGACARDDRAGAIPGRRLLTTDHCLLGLIVGMILLAGHLQIAFYGLLTGGILAAALTARQAARRDWKGVGRSIAVYLTGLALGLMLAMPQLLPAFELSRVSHRVGKPSSEGYRAYTEYAMQPAGAVMLFLPEFFGNDYDSNNPYWGFYVKSGPGDMRIAVRHNAAETAAYVGILPLLLGGLALARGMRRKAIDRKTLFFGGLALLSLLMALGTPVDALFYFGVPGFGQSGSPARCLVLWALAWSGLAALGLDTVMRERPTRREFAVVVGGVAAVLIVALNVASKALAAPPPGAVIPLLGQVFERIGSGWIRLLVLTAGGIVLLFPRPEKSGDTPGGAKGPRVATAENANSRISPHPTAAVFATALVVCDLFLVGIAINPTAPIGSVYPETPGIKLLREQAGHERIFPINQRWSLYKSPPAVLPPNAAAVYGLRDVQGYDSLLTGQYKAFANLFALPNGMGVVDASPPEVGNMVFFQNVNATLVPNTSARFGITPSAPTAAYAPQSVPPGNPLYQGDRDMVIYALPNGRPRAEIVGPAANGAAPVVWREDGPTRVTLGVRTGSDGVLNLNDQFFPGWHANVDGRPVTIGRQAAAPIYRAVPVPAGEHVVSFRYEPAGFRVGLYLALFCCTVTTAFAVQSRRPRR